MNCLTCGTAQFVHATVCPKCNTPVKKQRTSVWIYVLVGVGAAFLVLPILAVVAVAGVGKYIANAKVSEARQALPAIAQAAVRHYETGDADGVHRLCTSAQTAIPPEVSYIKGIKYMAAPQEWLAGSKTEGFACLGYAFAGPQYFQYAYEATADGFTVTAHGDLNGDGTLSTLEIRGQVAKGQLNVSPIVELSAEE